MKKLLSFIILNALLSSCGKKIESSSSDAPKYNDSSKSDTNAEAFSHSKSDLHEYIEVEDLSLITQETEKYTIDYLFKCGKSPLILSIATNLTRSDIVYHFISKSKKLNLKSNEGKTPFEYALKQDGRESKEQDNILKTLITAGADYNLHGLRSTEELMDYLDRYELINTRQLILEIDNLSPKILLNTIKRGDKKLLLSLGKVKNKLLKTLLSKRNYLIDIVDTNNLNSNDKIEIINTIADIKRGLTQTEVNQAAIHSSKRNYFDLFAHLAGTHFDVTAKDSTGSSALDYAVRSLNDEIVYEISDLLKKSHNISLHSIHINNACHDIKRISVTRYLSRLRQMSRTELRRKKRNIINALECN